MQIKRVHFPVIHSTNSWAKENTSQLDPEALTIITADEQTAGRGRFRRRWLSPKGCNLYVTYAFFTPNIDPVKNLTQILALAAYDAAVKWAAVQIKWPNDLVIGQKKLGGILCEVVEAPTGWANIIGLGLNINMQKSLLDTIDRPASSLMEECGYSLDLASLAEEVHQRFHNCLSDYLKNGFAPFLSSFKKALIHQPGDALRFHNFSEIFQGAFAGLNDDGSLALLLPDGSLKHCLSGELLEDY
jgi:BirA family biotin operon repressor/biotin-[acetyl-CoA-carboxylase] ligase